MKKHLATFLMVAYWIVLFILNPAQNPNGDHIKMGLLVIVLNYAHDITRKILKFLVPVILTAITYDSQRYYEDMIRGRIRVTEPYNFDKFFFGIKTANGVLTPNEWWQLHTHPVLDIISGFFYLTFVGIFVLISAWFFFYLSKKGTKKMAATEIEKRSPRMNWAFYWLNVAGFSTYYWYPAAPPWYVALYGLGPANMSARPNPAGAIRFDQALGTHFFSEMYGRSADVFGAIPSLHIAYPLLAVYFAFQFGALRIFSVCFYIVMCFSAVYLNHHYILDIMWGSTYALTIAFGMDYYFKRREEKTRLLTEKA